MFFLACIEFVFINVCHILNCHFQFSQMHSRELLDRYLSRALNIELQDGRILKAIDDEKYVLTLDYTIKMLSIHERCRCKVPVIIQGETGVGKTALLKMLSVLWNHSYMMEWNTVRSRLCDFLKSITKIVDCNAELYRVRNVNIDHNILQFFILNTITRIVSAQYKCKMQSATQICWQYVNKIQVSTSN